MCYNIYVKRRITLKNPSPIAGPTEPDRHTGTRISDNLSKSVNCSTIWPAQMVVLGATPGLVPKPPH